MSVGIWTFAFDGKPVALVREAAAEIEELGFDHLWFGEYPGREAMTQAALLLAATGRITVATGIARFDRRSPVATAGAQRALSEAYPGRFLLGLGGHLPGDRPVASIREYLDGMDAAALSIPDASPRPRRVLAALGPKMLRLAAERADGAHPYFVPPEHTARAREVLGPDAFLAVEQGVVLTATGARDIARREAAVYLEQARHHQANLRRLGFTDADFAGGGSDRLIDAVIAFGEEGIAERVRAHRDAGADHVCVQVLTGDDRLPRVEWRALAVALAGSAEP
ncbi:TIGR03620 family F420-dependent LLM class oxidoreductase [Amycolatopsis rhizosphaerae]|uniref:TIGR03620 family F420-dependent LLM class oxidoreductase n=1 Tax=Amycolatopsis rhizosphaerae TaxID=2053003 RepID=A0A558AAK9_9PSEU|nr:TIGR03620 family F420-dependent LLM class oxidoreductase [Amycolatopsis rhizosphaerae]TVT21298.1 TIGR03620 family F420-dependent LLM class oxidoreductase [Amycolatopsis rhizosphaerae]